MTLKLTSLLFVLLAPLGEAFTTRSSSRSTRVRIEQPLFAKYNPYGSSSSDDPYERNKARTDLRNFLTQRSLQSFVYLLNQCRDEHTVKYIEDILEFRKIDSFHGTGALNTTTFPAWDSFLLDLVTRPVDTAIVTMKGRQRRRGFGPQNNYMDNLGSASSKTEQPQTDKKKSALPERKPLPKPQRPMGMGSYLDNLSSSKPDTEEENSVAEIKPKKEETQKKAKPEKQTFKMGLSGYLENLSSSASSESPQPKKKASNKKPRKNPFVEEKRIEFEIHIDPASLLTRMISVREQISNEWSHDLEILIKTNDQILVSYVRNQKETRAEESTKDDAEDYEEDDEDWLDDLTAPYSDNSEDEVVVFDKDAMVMLTNSISNEGKDSSPFRRSNFDLLVLLSTQESIHRVLRQFKEQDESDNFEWLREFYSDRVKDHFDGHQSVYGRADQFLEELLLEPPSIQQQGSKVHFIDPMKMAEDIIKMRSQVAREWKEIVSQTPKEHVDLRRLLLTRRMMERSEENPLDSIVGTISETLVDEKKKSKATEKPGVVFETGAFE